MTFLQKDKTNLKYILILVILAVITGGGILSYYWQIRQEIEREVKIQELRVSEEKESEKVPPEEIKTLKEKIPPGEEIIVDLEKFNTVEEAILYYLNQYPNEPDVLEKLFGEPLPGAEETYFLESGKIIRRGPKLIKWKEKADLDNDGFEELSIVFVDPSEGIRLLGPLNGFSIFSKKGRLYEIKFSLERNFYSEYFIRDINKDNKLEVVLVSDWCGAHTCGNIITTIQFDGEKWKNLTPNVEISNGDIKWEDQDGDDIEEIILHGGTIGSAGAGMQRGRTDIYAYQEGKYRLVKTIWDPPDNIYYLMLDANRALKENNLTEAFKLANQALLNSNSGVSFNEYAFINERDQTRILSYAGIEAMLVYLKQSLSDLDSVNSLLQEINQKYNKFDNPYIRAAQILRDTYRATGNRQKACQAMEDEILKISDKAEFLSWYGYNTEKLDFSDLCPWSINQ